MLRIWLSYRRAWSSYRCLGAWKSLETELRIKSFYPRDWPKLAQDWLPAKYLIDRQWRHSSNKSSPTSIHFKMFQNIWICLIMPILLLLLLLNSILQISSLYTPKLYLKCWLIWLTWLKNIFHDFALQHVLHKMLFNAKENVKRLVIDHSIGNPYWRKELAKEYFWWHRSQTRASQTLPWRSLHLRPCPPISSPELKSISWPFDNERKTAEVWKGGDPIIRLIELSKRKLLGKLIILTQKNPPLRMKRRKNQREIHKGN